MWPLKAEAGGGENWLRGFLPAGVSYAVTPCAHTCPPREPLLSNDLVRAIWDALPPHGRAEGLVPC